MVDIVVDDIDPLAALMGVLHKKKLHFSYGMASLRQCPNAERPVGRYYRPQYRPPSKSPSDYCTNKITRLLDSIELAKNFIEEARTVEKIKIR